MNWKFENEVKHPAAPLPFYVIDLGKYKVEEKMVWMKLEIGADRTLEEFVEKFVELFRGMETQSLRQACLKTYALYSGRTISKEVDLPPWEREVFKRAFDPKQPRLCQECATALPADNLLYCSNACKQAGKHFIVRSVSAP